jgi:tetratricopeptide (TPR) repeat protein
MSARAEPLPKTLVVGVLLLTILVLGLGGAVVAVKLRPEPLPTNAVDRTLAAWEQAVADDPDSDTAQTGLGLALLDAGRTDEARAAFEEAMALNDRNWMAPFQLGLLLWGSEPQRALELMKGATKIAPADQKAVILIAQGDLMVEQGDLGSARDAYRRSIIFNPFTYDAHFGYASVLEQTGDLDAALDEYREAGRFAPGDEAVAEAIARLEDDEEAS